MSEPRDTIDDSPGVLALHAAIRRDLPQLEELLAETNEHWCYEDGIYRFYHGSCKVHHRLAPQTERIVRALRGLAPDRPLHRDFQVIVRAGTNDEWQPTDDSSWADAARPIVEALVHAKYFLEMAVKCGRELEAPPRLMPSGWAALLELFGLR